MNSSRFISPLSGLAVLTDAESRSISAENPDGGKAGGARAVPSPDDPVSRPARDLGVGWKCRPYVLIKPESVFEMADICGPGVVQSIWCTGNLGRSVILRIYWDNDAHPSVEVPICDFFGMPWFDFRNPRSEPELYPTLNSLPVAVNPLNGFNCFWEMPFAKHCRMTVENRHPTETVYFYYQVNYSLNDVPENAARFCAGFRRENPLEEKKEFVILDRVRGRGHYVGTVMGWGVNCSGWFGEGEIKFHLDGDREFPTICGTGTEDYFGGSYNWDANGYKIYSTPFCGMHQVIRPDGLYRSQHRHAMYRWHIVDPIRFKQDIKVTIQALGWRPDGRFLPHRPDICATAFFYQEPPTTPLPPLGTPDELEII